MFQRAPGRLVSALPHAPVPSEGGLEGPRRVCRHVALVCGLASRLAAAMRRTSCDSTEPCRMSLCHSSRACRGVRGAADEAAALPSAASGASVALFRMPWLMERARRTPSRQYHWRWTCRPPDPQQALACGRGDCSMCSARMAPAGSSASAAG